MWAWVVVLLVLGGGAFVRLAPIDGVQVHAAIEGTQDRDGKGYSLRVVAGDEAVLRDIDAVMRGLARTRVVAGSLEEGRMSYVTRSKWLGFPDFTTIEMADGQIKLFARLRFGRSDMGVNRARLRHVLKVAGVSSGG